MDSTQDAQEVRLDLCVVGEAGSSGYGAVHVQLVVEDTPVVPLRLDLSRVAGSLSALPVCRGLTVAAPVTHNSLTVLVPMPCVGDVSR